MYGGATPQPHRGTGASSTTSASSWEFWSRQAGAPLEVADKRSAELRIIRQLGVVSGLTHRRSEAKALLRGDPEVSVMGEHPGIAAQSLRVVGRSAKHLGPPQYDVSPVVLADAAWKKRTEQFISFDAVVERIDQPSNSRGATRPFEESGHAAHLHSVLTSMVQVVRRVIATDVSRGRGRRAVSAVLYSRRRP